MGSSHKTLNVAIIRPSTALVVNARARKYAPDPSLCVCERSGHFEKGVAEGAVDPSFNPVMALRLSVLKDSAVWAILSEVSAPERIGPFLPPRSHDRFR